MIGTDLGHYRIMRALGRGGMGEVWEAEDRKLGRRVAVKLLPPEMGRDPERRRRFEREARAVAGLNHPHIVTLYSIEEAEGRLFLTMELVIGRPLTALLAPGGMRLDRLLDLAIGRQMWR